MPIKQIILQIPTNNVICLQSLPCKKFRPITERLITCALVLGLLISQFGLMQNFYRTEMALLISHTVDQSVSKSKYSGRLYSIC